ncbi:MAG: response regulator transcription factor [Bacillota bacterium]
MIKTVLVVDDSPMVHKLIKKVLDNNGYTLCGMAKNGKEAIEMTEMYKPDLIFMDITMPVMNGMEAVRRIKGNHRDIQIIMLSAMGDKEIVDQAKELGVELFLQKPFDEPKIINAIKAAGK